MNDSKPILIGIVTILIVYLAYDRLGRDKLSFMGENARIQQNMNLKETYMKTVDALTVKENHRRTLSAVRKARLNYMKGGPSAVGELQNIIRQAGQRAGISLQVSTVSSSVRPVKNYKFIDYIDVRVSMRRISMQDISKVLREVNREKQELKWVSFSLSRERPATPTRSRTTASRGNTITPAAQGPVTFKASGTLRVFLLNPKAETILKESL